MDEPLDADDIEAFVVNGFVPLRAAFSRARRISSGSTSTAVTMKPWCAARRRDSAPDPHPTSRIAVSGGVTLAMSSAIGPNSEFSYQPIGEQVDALAPGLRRLRDA